MSLSPKRTLIAETLDRSGFLKFKLYREDFTDGTMGYSLTESAKIDNSWSVESVLSGNSSATSGVLSAMLGHLFMRILLLERRLTYVGTIASSCNVSLDETESRLFDIEDFLGLIDNPSLLDGKEEFDPFAPDVPDTPVNIALPAKVLGEVELWHGW